MQRDPGRSQVDDLVFQAIEFAAAAHRGQYRKGSRIPYIIHPMRVAHTLIEMDLDEQVVAAGLLHDTTEDTPVTLAQLEASFGARVASLVAAVSEADKSRPWEERKRQTIDEIASLPLDALLLECADKYDNIRSLASDQATLGDALWARFNRPREKQAWYYTSLAQAFDRRVAGESSERARRLVDRFCQMVEAVFGADGQKLPPG